MELYHLKIYIDDLLHRAVGPVGPGIYLGQQHFLFFISFNALLKIVPS